MTIRSEIKGGVFRLLFDELVHVSIVRKELIGATAYLRNGSHYIDFHTNGKKITTQYNTSMLWKNVLLELKKKKII